MLGRNLAELPDEVGGGGTDRDGAACRRVNLELPILGPVRGNRRHLRPGQVVGDDSRKVGRLAGFCEAGTKLVATGDSYALEEGDRALLVVDLLREDEELEGRAVGQQHPTLCVDHQPPGGFEGQPAQPVALGLLAPLSALRHLELPEATEEDHNRDSNERQHAGEAALERAEVVTNVHSYLRRRTRRRRRSGEVKSRKAIKAAATSTAAAAVVATAASPPNHP